MAKETTMLATIARFCVRHRRWVLAAWMLLFIAGITIGMTVFGRLHDSHGGARTESMQGYTIAQQASSAGQRSRASRRSQSMNNDIPTIAQARRAKGQGC